MWRHTLADFYSVYNINLWVVNNHESFLLSVTGGTSQWCSPLKSQRVSKSCVCSCPCLNGSVHPKSKNIFFLLSLKLTVLIICAKVILFIESESSDVCVNHCWQSPSDSAEWGSYSASKHSCENWFGNKKYLSVGPTVWMWNCCVTVAGISWQLTVHSLLHCNQIKGKVQPKMKMQLLFTQ